MHTVKKSVIVPYTAKTMFDLVSDIESYPKYLSWCKNAQIISSNNQHVIGRIDIEYFKIKTYFITKNINKPYSTINIELIDGPFKKLSGEWKFISLGYSGCKVEFYLQYKFSNFILEKAISPVFNYINTNIIECFIKEAAKISKID